MTLGANQIAAYAADLLDLEDQIEALQDGKRDLYKTIREEHGRLEADAIKNALRIVRMDSEKRAKVEATDAETARMVKIIEVGTVVATPAPARKREPRQDDGHKDDGSVSRGLVGPANAGDDRAANTKPTPIHEPAIAADPAGEGVTALSPREAEPSSADNPSTAAGMDRPGTARMSPAGDPQPEPQDRIGGLGDDPQVAIPAAGTQAPPVDTIPTAADNARRLRPFCQHADDLNKCPGMGKRHCTECLKIQADADGVAA